MFKCLNCQVKKISFETYPKLSMKKAFSILFRNMFNTLESSREKSECLLNSFNGVDSYEGKKQTVKDYLTRHFGNETFQKVRDFPLSSEWINTMKPLSIYQDFKGKIVLLDFFTYCCINCIHVLPDLKKLEEKFSIEEGLVVVGVHCAKFTNEKQTANITSAVKRYSITHALMNDSEGIVWNAFSVNCWPTLILIGPHMEVLLTLTGEGHLKLLSIFIEETLQIMTTRNLLSNHSLPQIEVTNELKYFGTLAFPGKITAFETGEMLAISDSGHHRILIMNENGAVMYTVGGYEFKAGFNDGNFNVAQFNSPQGVVFKDRHLLYVADTNNHAIRMIDLKEEYVKTVCGVGIQGDDKIGGKPLHQQLLSSPWDICFGKNTNILFIAMAGIHQIWALFLVDEQAGFLKGQKDLCKAIAGSGREENRNNHYPHAAGFAQPSGLTYCSERDSIFIADSESSAVRELNLKTGKVSAVVGGHQNPNNLFAFGDVDGTGCNVKLQHPLGVAWYQKHGKLFVADSYNHKIKVVDIFKNTCTSLELDTKFNEPGGLCVLENHILIADTNNHCIKSCNSIDFAVELFPIGMPVENTAEPVTAEKTINMSKNGGELMVNVNINIPANVSLTENAPSFWSTNFGDTWDEKRYDFSINKKFEIDVPKYIDRNHKLRIKGVAYVCKHSVCAIEKMLFVVNINFTDTSETTCDFNYTIST